MEKIILKNPHITEKSVSLSKMGQYVFAVSKNVSSTGKPQVISTKPDPLEGTIMLLM